MTIDLNHKDLHAVIRKYLLPLLALASVTQAAFAHEGHAHASNDLPNILILGDSISMGYMKPLQVLLKGEANVVRPNENCGPSTNGLAKLEQWLGESHWDVIHFNFGLHDLKYINDKGDLVPVENGQIQVPIEQYEKNLQEHGRATALYREILTHETDPARIQEANRRLGDIGSKR